MSGYCHCKTCSRGHGVSPVHLVVVPNEAFTFTKNSEDNTKIVEDKILFCRCKTCGVCVYQQPKSKPFTAVLPVNFRIEQGGVACALPDNLKPTFHLNYENRLLDSADDLPKFKEFPGENAVMLNNDGSLNEN